MAPSGKANSWLYILTKAVSLTMTCESIKNLEIQGVGMLTINTKTCRATTLDYILIPTLESKTEYENKIRTKKLEDDDCCTDENLKYFALLQGIGKIKLSNINLNDLTNAAQKLHVMKGKLSDILSRPSPIYHFSYIAYAVGILIILMILLYCFKCFKGGGSFCLKLCFLNGWFNKQNKTRIAPQVKFTKSENSETGLVSLGETSLTYREPQYRFDLN